MRVPGAYVQTTITIWNLVKQNNKFTMHKYKVFGEIITQKLFVLVKMFPFNTYLQINLHLFTATQRQSLKTKLPFIIYDIFYFGSLTSEQQQNSFV